MHALKTQTFDHQNPCTMDSWKAMAASFHRFIHVVAAKIFPRFFNSSQTDGAYFFFVYPFHKRVHLVCKYG